VQRGIGDRVAPLFAPEARHAEHDRDAPARGIVFQEVQNLPPVIEHGARLFLVLEPAAPQGKQGFAAVAQVLRVAREPRLAHEGPSSPRSAGRPCPGGQAAQVVHQRVHPPVLPRPGAAVFEDGVVVRERAGPREGVDEPLQEHAVDAVLLHPAEKCAIWSSQVS
jgi:hypothetical protein